MPRKEETESRFVYDLGNGQWDIPRLRTLLPEVLSNSHRVEDSEVEDAFRSGAKKHVSQRPLLESVDGQLNMFRLAIEAVTERMARGKVAGE